jgi:FkbM family methyltransferase
MLIKLKNDLSNTILGMKEFMKSKTMEIEEFNETINNEYRQKQNIFCTNIDKYLNHEFEKKIKLAKVIFKNLTYLMFVYKEKDGVSNSIIKANVWERYETYNLIKGLNFYTKKMNLTNKDIYIIDVGGNVGWYTFLFGKFGYNVISFEPSKINYYILYKNYCINREVNVTLINKGLFTEEKKCNIYYPKNNIGDGMINCNEKVVENSVNNGEIILTKLSNYIKFFENKNLAMIKMDIEGLEGKAIESGIELITKYHVPFIFIEFIPKYLSEYGTNPQKFLEMFIINGYKINLLNFFEKKMYDIKYLVKKNRNLYIVNTQFLN